MSGFKYRISAMWRFGGIYTILLECGHKFEAAATDVAGKQLFIGKRIECPDVDCLRSAGDLMLFPLGQVVWTRGAVAAFTEAGDNPASFIRRHLVGDWGDVDAHDRKANWDALDDHLRILSVYHLSTGVKFYILTEANRSATTLLLPEEY